MRKKIMLSFFIALTVIEMTYSQDDNVNNETNGVSSNHVFRLDEYMSNRSGLWTVNSFKEEGIDGSPLLDKKWQSKLIVHTKDGKTFNLPSSNYNTKEDAFVTKVANDSVFVFDNKMIAFVEYNNITFKKFENDKGVTNYYSVIYEGTNISLLKKIGCYIRKGTINPMTSQKESQDEYMIKEDYFILENDKLKEIRLNKKKILNTLSRKDDVKVFMKKNHLSYTKESDVVKLMRYYDKL